MLVDVHTHIPTHQGNVPIDEARSDPLIGHGARLSGSLPEYTEAMSAVDKAIVFGLAPRPGEPPAGRRLAGGLAGQPQPERHRGERGRHGPRPPHPVHVAAP